MTTKLTNAFGKVYLTIKADAANKWVHVIWEGYLSENTIKTGGQAILDTIKVTGYNCVLTDMLLVLGPIRTTGWTEDVWTPAMAKAGLEHMALVNAPGAIAATDIFNYHNQQKHFHTEIFSKTADAGQWLRQQCRNNRTFLQQA